MVASGMVQGNVTPGADDRPQRSLTRPRVSGVILAGGASTRLGGHDKARLNWGDRSLIEHIVARIAPQVDELLISHHGSGDDYRDLGLATCRDRHMERLGPLAGISAALSHCRCDWLLVVPCDAPSIPADLARRLWQADAGPRPIRYARCAGRDHYLHALLHRGLASDLRRHLQSGGRKVGDWYREHAAVAVDFTPREHHFVNVNTPRELEQLLALKEKTRGS